MTEEKINELARLAAQASISLHPLQSEKASVDLFFKAYNYAKKMIMLKRLDEIETTDEMRQLAQVASQAAVTWNKNSLSIEEDVYSFLLTYEHLAEYFSTRGLNTNCSSKQEMKMAFSTVQSILSAHGRYFDKNLVDVVLEIYTYTLEKLTIENKKVEQNTEFHQIRK